MELIYAITIGVVFACGVNLVQRNHLAFVAFGLGLMGSAINLLILVAGRVGGMSPALLDGGAKADEVGNPLPQAFVLTAIVIGFAVVSLVLAISAKSKSEAD